MFNTKSFISASFGVTFAVVFTSVMLVLFAAVVLCLWWVDVKKQPLKQLGRNIKMGFVTFIEKFGEIFSADKPVRTVYSDKSLNYSGTEFLPIPTKAPTNQYTYEFVGWDKNGIDEKGNIVIRAIYLQKVVKCNINIFDDDKVTLFRTDVVEYGSGVNLSDIKPKKPETKEFSYEFIGWDKDTTAFYGNENVYAVYKAIPKKYDYRFLEEDGETIISQGTAIYGTPIIPPAAPKKSSKNVGDIYEFIGWGGYEEGMVLTRDVDFVAQFALKQVGGVGTSSIIKTDGETIKVVDEDELSHEEDSTKKAIEMSRLANAIKFDTGSNQSAKEEVAEVKVGNTGVIRKKLGMTIELNTDAEKFQAMNQGRVEAHTDKDIHQKIQLMTVKKTAGKKEDTSGVIVATPKPEEEPKDDDLLKNMMINKIKIDKRDTK